MHMLDKSGSCGKFDTYQRPEGFPVGTSEYLASSYRSCCVIWINSFYALLILLIKAFFQEAEVRAMAKERQKKDNHNLSEC